MCRIEGCNGGVLAKGLCAKHYMRVRRNGSPEVVKRRGAKPNQGKLLVVQAQQAFFEGWSIAKFERFWFALSCYMHGWEPTEADAKLAAAITLARRSNGTVNVSKLVRIAHDDYIVKHGKDVWGNLLDVFHRPIDENGRLLDGEDDRKDR